MKKLLTMLALTGLLATQAQAVRITVNADGNPTGDIVSATNVNNVKNWKLEINGVNPKGQEVTPVDVDWNLDYTFVEGKVTYWTKIYGNYDINLGMAAISAEQGGTLNVYTTNTDWSTPYGIGLTSNYDPYRIRNYDKTAEDPKTGHMSVYIGHPTEHQYGGIEYHVNMFNYPCTEKYNDASSASVGMDSFEGTVTYPAADGSQKSATLPATEYTSGLTDYDGIRKDKTFGFTLTGAIGEDGEAKLRFIVPEEIEVPDITVDGLATGASVDSLDEGARVSLSTSAWLDSEGNYADLPNLGYGFDLENLRSWGASTLEDGETNPSYWALSPYSITYIWITKDLPVPEPATATLSLLALAGLAARRRRR